MPPKKQTFPIKVLVVLHSVNKPFEMVEAIEPWEKPFFDKEMLRMVRTAVLLET